MPAMDLPPAADLIKGLRGLLAENKIENETDAGMARRYVMRSPDEFWESQLTWMHALVKRGGKRFKDTLE